MIRDYSTGRTKFVRANISDRQCRSTNVLEGGLDKKTMLWHVKRMDQDLFLIDIFDDIHGSVEDIEKCHCPKHEAERVAA